MTQEQFEKRLRRAEKKLCAHRNYPVYEDNTEALAAGLCIGNTYAKPDGTLWVVLAPALRLVFDDLASIPAAVIADPTDVAQWNTFFDLPTNGTPFTKVVITGTEIRLTGGSEIYLKSGLFDDGDNVGYSLLEFVDETDCIIYVGDDAFGDDNNQGCPFLTTVFLPAVTQMCDYCFQGCNVLTTVYIPLLSNAGDGCFNSCEMVSTFNFPLLTTVGNGFFQYCSSATTFNLPLVSLVEDYGFSNCVSLQIISLPSLITAGSASFSNCPIITINFPLLTTAGASCFNSCTSAQDFILPELLTAGDFCFGACNNVVDFNLPKLTSVGDSCFASCTDAESFDFPLLTTIGPNAFESCTSVVTINIPSCTALGLTVGNDNVFLSIVGNTITLTVPTALATVNAGNPDGDIATLAANNTETIVYV